MRERSASLNWGWLQAHAYKARGTRGLWVRVFGPGLSVRWMPPWPHSWTHLTFSERYGYEFILRFGRLVLKPLKRPERLEKDSAR